MSGKRDRRRLDDGSMLCVDESYAKCASLATRYVVRQRNWYRHRARVVRRWFRIFGVAVIALSASLPIIAAVDFSDSQLVITVVSVLVAALTALRTFFQWDGQWRVLKVADWKLTALISWWEADICAIDATDENKAAAAAIARTRRLLADADEVIDSESSSFFTAVSWPETSPGRAAQNGGAPGSPEPGQNGSKETGEQPALEVVKDEPGADDDAAPGR